MSKRLLASVAVAVSAVAALAASLTLRQGPAAAPHSPVQIAQRRAVLKMAQGPFPEDRYRALLSRSIFSSQRAQQQSSAKQAGPESGLALKGIAEDGAQFTAFVEDGSSGKMLRLQVGDMLASGRIANMTLHNLDYDAGGKRVRVQVGQNLSSGILVNAGSPPAPGNLQPQRHFASASN